MATLGASMVTLLTDNWAGAGAAPTFGFLIDFRKDLTPTTEQVLVRLPIHEDVMPINDTYSNFKFTMQIRVKSTVSEDRLKVLADETIRIINTYAITGITRQFAKRGENTSNRKQQVFSYDVWALLEEHVSTAGTSYSSPGAGDVVFPADISVLGGDVLISGDPAVLTLKDTSTGRSNTITAPSGTTDPVIFETGNAWSFKVDTIERIGIDDAGDTTITGDLEVTGIITTATAAQIDDLLMFGSANATWVPLTLEGAFVFASPPIPCIAVQDHYYVYNEGTEVAAFKLLLPCNKGALKLYLNTIRWYQPDADGANFVNRVRVFAKKSDGTTDTLTDDGTNHTTIASQTVTCDDDLDGYANIMIYFELTCATDLALELSAVEAEVYYTA